MSIDCGSSDIINVGAIIKKSTSRMVSVEVRGTIGSTSSGSYVDMPGTPTTGSLTKIAGTNLMVEMFVSSRKSDGGTISYGVNVGGIDYRTCVHLVNTTTKSYPSSGAVLITGLGAGTYTAVARWKTDGTGTISQIATNQTLVRMWEVAA